MSETNDHLVLICGKSAVGKTASLMGLKDPEGVMYLNCESGKRTPFKAAFKQYTVNDPLQIYEAFLAAEGMPEVHTIVVDGAVRVRVCHQLRKYHESMGGLRPVLQEFDAAACCQVHQASHLYRPYGRHLKRI